MTMQDLFFKEKYVQGVRYIKGSLFCIIFETNCIVSHSTYLGAPTRVKSSSLARLNEFIEPSLIPFCSKNEVETCYQYGIILRVAQGKV